MKEINTEISKGEAKHIIFHNVGGPHPLSLRS